MVGGAKKVCFRRLGSMVDGRCLRVAAAARGKFQQFYFTSCTVRTAGSVALVQGVVLYVRYVWIVGGQAESSRGFGGNWIFKNECF